MALLSLLRKKTFLPLFLTQFFAAFNDNVFKLAMLTLISYFLAGSEQASEQYQALAGALFIAPFFFLSATAGQLADKLDKARLTRLIKLYEIGLMVLGAAGLYYGNIPIMMTVLTGLGIHSTFFGPIKYAILPDHLPQQVLLGATALVEGSTFLAILLGTTLGTLSIVGVKSGTLAAIHLTITMAVCGYLASLFIPKAPSTLSDLHVDWHIFRASMRILRDVSQFHGVLPAMLAISWFWSVGTVVLTKLPDFVHFVLQGDTGVFAFFLALFSIGIGVGSVSINRLLAGRIKLTHVPYAMLAMSVFLCDLYFAVPAPTAVSDLVPMAIFFQQLAHSRIAVDFFLLAFTGGIFLAPLYAYLQTGTAKSMRARTIAANNIYNAAFMVAGTLLVMALIALNASIAQVFLVTGVLNAIAVLWLWPFVPRA